MGDEFFLEITCPDCGRVDSDVCYAPTCDAIVHQCPCGYVTNLAEYTGIRCEDASNRIEMTKMISEMKERDVGSSPTETI